MIMINKEVLRSTNPCVERWKNYLEFYSEFNGPIDEFLDLDKISYDDKIWVARRVLNRNQLVYFAVLCAESVFHIYEDKYPSDKRISDCLSYMETIVDFSDLTNEQRDKLAVLRNDCWSARTYAAAAYAAADAAAAADATYAVYAAAYAATYAVYAADAAVYAADAAAAAYAADAAAAAYAAAYAASAAYAAAYTAGAVYAENKELVRENQRNLNLQFLKMAASL